MFGQRKTFFEHMFAWGPFAFVLFVYPFVLAFNPVGFLVMAIAFAGLGCIIAAKWPAFKQKKFDTFGPGEMPSRSRQFYFGGYGLIFLSIVVGFLAI